jgi:hypothetical protein
MPAHSTRISLKPIGIGLALALGLWIFSILSFAW